MRAAGTDAEREELISRILRDGILYRTGTQAVISRDGSSHRWMLDSLAVTLNPRGAELAGKLVLERLRRFDGRQVATYGLTGIPILQSAVLQSEGRYNGLIIRKDLKNHGSLKRIEGHILPDEPTILVDDSIASGQSMKEGIERLEAAGLRVEGCVALVRFGWDGGCSDLQERGYHVESVYDIAADFMAQMAGEEGPDYNPTKVADKIQWSPRTAPNGLEPAELARQVLSEYFVSGEVLRPPAFLARNDYDSTGGTWVSIRSKADMFERHARNGFWHFPWEESPGVAEDIVRSAYQTAQDLPANQGQNILSTSNLAVTLFSRLEKTTVGKLDNNKYGIVVVSSERPEVMGGALPLMPGIRDEWQQFRHARYNNADLDPWESYVIYRHKVTKFPEPGAAWPGETSPGTGDSSCRTLASFAREIALSRRAALPANFTLPTDMAYVFVTIFIAGHVRGCMGCAVQDPAADIPMLVDGALHDDRFEDTSHSQDPNVSVSVSVLTHELEMGDFSREEVIYRYRNGQQALAVEQGEREGLLLPCVATWQSLDAEDFVDEVIDKAGITRPPYNWRRFDCDTWLADRDGVWKVDGAFKEAPAAEASTTYLARLYLEYLLRNQLPDGSLYFGYYAFENSLYQGMDAARLAHAAWTFSRASQESAAIAVLRYLLSTSRDASTELPMQAFVLLTLCVPSMGSLHDSLPACPSAAELAEKLWHTLDSHGRIATWIPDTANDDADDEEETEDRPVSDDLQNYVPGQVLLALAAAASNGVHGTNERLLLRAFQYYRHRFRYQRDFGQVSWMLLAWSAWWEICRESEMAAFVYEVADWILDFQSEQSGAFLTDHQPDTPGYTSAVYLEGIAAAIRVASAMGHIERYSRYESAYRIGFQFLHRLTVQEHDFCVLPNGEYACGGVRENLYSSHVRTDFVQHSLAAILERIPDVFLNHSNTEQEIDNGPKETQKAQTTRSHY